jgi:hypothetical protein
MTTVLCRFRVADHDRWRRGYADAQAAWTTPEVKTAMEVDGIDMSSLWFDYFDAPELPKEE